MLNLAPKLEWPIGCFQQSGVSGESADLANLAESPIWRSGKSSNRANTCQSNQIVQVVQLEFGHPLASDKRECQIAQQPGILARLEHQSFCQIGKPNLANRAIGRQTGQIAFHHPGSS